MSETRAESPCIIVADGAVIVRNVLSDYLRACGYKVIDAADADEVIAVLQQGSATVRAVLCDADLGGSMNAFALRLWLRQNRPDIDVVLAGNVSAAAKAAGEMCDEGPHLRRPYDPQAVHAHIQRLLAKARK